MSEIQNKLMDSSVQCGHQYQCQTISKNQKIGSYNSRQHVIFGLAFIGEDNFKNELYEF